VNTKIQVAFVKVLEQENIGIPNKLDNINEIFWGASSKNNGVIV